MGLQAQLRTTWGPGWVPAAILPSRVGLHSPPGTSSPLRMAHWGPGGQEGRQCVGRRAGARRHPHLLPPLLLPELRDLPGPLGLHQPPPLLLLPHLLHQGHLLGGGGREAWPLVAPTRSHRRGSACVAGGRRSCLDGAELLWAEPQARLTVTIKPRSKDGAHTACPDPRNSQMREAVPLLFHKQDVNRRETKWLKVRNSAIGG